MIALRRSSSALRRGSLAWLRNSDEFQILTFLRQSPEEEILIAINFSSRPFFGTVEVANGNAYREVTPDVGPPLPPDAPIAERAARKQSAGLPALSLEAWGYRVFRRPLR
jgi:glycosidase